MKIPTASQSTHSWVGLLGAAGGGSRGYFSIFVLRLGRKRYTAKRCWCRRRRHTAVMRKAVLGLGAGTHEDETPLSHYTCVKHTSKFAWRLLHHLFRVTEHKPCSSASRSVLVISISDTRRSLHFSKKVLIWVSGESLKGKKDGFNDGTSNFKLFSKFIREMKTLLDSQQL